MEADYPTLWGQLTKRYLKAPKTVGCTGEIQRWNKSPAGSQRTFSTPAPKYFSSIRPQSKPSAKAREENKLSSRPSETLATTEGKGSMQYLPILGGLNSTKSTDTIPGDPGGSGCVWSGMAGSRKGREEALDLPV